MTLLRTGNSFKCRIKHWNNTNNNVPYVSYSTFKSHSISSFTFCFSDIPMMSLSLSPTMQQRNISRGEIAPRKLRAHPNRLQSWLRRRSEWTRTTRRSWHSSTRAVPAPDPPEQTGAGENLHLDEGSPNANRKYATASPYRMPDLDLRHPIRGPHRIQTEILEPYGLQTKNASSAPLHATDEDVEKISVTNTKWNLPDRQALLSAKLGRCTVVREPDPGRRKASAASRERGVPTSCPPTDLKVSQFS